MNNPESPTSGFDERFIKGIIWESVMSVTAHTGTKDKLREMIVEHVTSQVLWALNRQCPPASSAEESELKAAAIKMAQLWNFMVRPGSPSREIIQDMLVVGEDQPFINAVSELNQALSFTKEESPSSWPPIDDSFVPPHAPNLADVAKSLQIIEKYLRPHIKRGSVEYAHAKVCGLLEWLKRESPSQCSECDVLEKENQQLQELVELCRAENLKQVNWNLDVAKELSDLRKANPESPHTFSTGVDECKKSESSLNSFTYGPGSRLSVSARSSCWPSSDTSSIAESCSSESPSMASTTIGESEMQTAERVWLEFYPNAFEHADENEKSAVIESSILVAKGLMKLNRESPHTSLTDDLIRKISYSTIRHCHAYRDLESWDDEMLARVYSDEMETIEVALRKREAWINPAPVSLTTIGDIRIRKDPSAQCIGLEKCHVDGNCPHCDPAGYRIQELEKDKAFWMGTTKQWENNYKRQIVLLESLEKENIELRKAGK